MTCRSGLQNNPTDEKRTRNAFDSWLKRAISEWNQNFNGVAKTRVRVTPRVRVRVRVGVRVRVRMRVRVRVRVRVRIVVGIPI